MRMPSSKGGEAGPLAYVRGKRSDVYEPMALVLYKLINDMGMLPTKRSHREGHEAKRGGGKKPCYWTSALQAAMVNVSELHQCTLLDTRQQKGITQSR